MNKLEPLFELGLYEGDNPYCKVLPEQAGVCPVILAALTTTMFETVMSGVPDKDQIAFEKHYRDALDILLDARFNYDVIKKYPGDEGYEDED